MPNNKSGGICFRYDDNLPLDQLSQVAAIFRKNDSRFCLSVNLAALPDNPGYVPFLQKLDQEGFEIMDHCPNHCTNVFWTDASYMYKKHPGVDHLNIPSRMVCLKYEELSPKVFRSRGIVRTVNNLVISKKNGEFKNWDNSLHYLYFPSLNRITDPSKVLNTEPFNIDSLRVQSFWGEQLDLGNSDNLEYYVIEKNDIHLTAAARSVLALESLRLFNKFNLRRPTTWIQPGSKTPQLSAVEIKETFGDKFRYSSGATNGGLKCFNDSRVNARYEMQWGDFSCGESPLVADKVKISDKISKNYVLIGGNHFSDISIPWAVYLARLDSLLEWCNQKRIPVKCYREWSRTLYDIPQNPYIDIFPKLDTDLDNNGKPDGFELENGVLIKNDGPDTNRYSLEARNAGPICSISGLAGFEKGENEFFIWTKGSPGNFVTVTMEFQESKHRLSYTFPAENRSWTRYSVEQSTSDLKSLVMPADYSYVHIRISCSAYKGGNVRIGGMRLNKKGGNPLQIISKYDTLTPARNKHEYQVITAQYYFNDRLTYELINSPSWLKIDDKGFISGTTGELDGDHSITIRVRDQSGNTAMQTYSLRRPVVDSLILIWITSIVYFLYYFYLLP